MKWHPKNDLKKHSCYVLIKFFRVGKFLVNNACKYSLWKENPIFEVRANKQADVHIRGKKELFYIHHNILPDNDLNFDRNWLSWVIRNAIFA